MSPNAASRSLMSVLIPLVAACGGDDPSGGVGDAEFTTWGEAYIEQGIGPDSTGEAGFVDGWTVKFEKFLVNFGEITVRDASGAVAGAQAGTALVDNVRPGRKSLFRITGLEAKAYPQVSYALVPVTPTTRPVAATDADRDEMAARGWSIWVTGAATKGGETKRFSWGFATNTALTECKAVEDGREQLGIVVRPGQTDTSELTTHGDHFFYDRLQASPDPAVATRLRFDAIAAADADGDGDVTLEELRAATLSVPTYNPSPFAVTHLGDFITSLSRSVGHYRGEGECVVGAR
ncbi:MAG: hypothetical protein IT374_03405 [Polyangiaceae bacterium]|nr:hypothetical protein [Polyangiaceae bacterium]